jgi:hypothetical protein
VDAAHTQSTPHLPQLPPTLPIAHGSFSRGALHRAPIRPTLCGPIHDAVKSRFRSQHNISVMTPHGSCTPSISQQPAAALSTCRDEASTCDSCCREPGDGDEIKRGHPPTFYMGHYMVRERRRRRYFPDRRASTGLRAGHRGPAVRLHFFLVPVTGINLNAAQGKSRMVGKIFSMPNALENRMWSERRIAVNISRSRERAFRPAIIFLSIGDADNQRHEREIRPDLTNI